MLQHLDNQDYPYYEVIFVVTPYLDGTRKQIDAYIESKKDIGLDARYKMIVESKTGIAHARNAGVSTSYGDLIAFCDIDDFWASGYLSELARMYERYPFVNLYFTAHRDLETTENTYLDSSFKNCDDMIKISYFEVCFTNGMLPNLPTFSALRGEWARANPFDPNMIIGEDVDIFTRATINSDCCYSNYMGGYYRWLQPESLSNKKLPKILNIPSKEILDTHWMDNKYLHDYALRWYISTIVRNLKNGFKKEALKQLAECPPITPERKHIMLLLRLAHVFPYKWLEFMHVVYNHFFWEKRKSIPVTKEELDAI